MSEPRGIARDWQFCLNNPDAPYGVYSYPYYLRAGGQVWKELQARVRELVPDHLFVVADSGLPSHLAASVQHHLSAVSPCTLHTFPGNEHAKTLETVGLLAAEVKQAGVSRHSVIVGLGGGLAGNVAGLLAALLYRGITFLQVPTTLLAMSDSTLSLKQAVNTAEGKNIIGAYKAPAFVWSDLAFLDHLPAREVRAACGELIKNVLAICPQHLEEVATLLRPDAHYTDTQYVRVIELCIAAKSAVMRHDALEKHEAFLLEYGHTVGHALEFRSRGGIPHGLAIGIGLVVEAKIASILGLLSQADFEAHLTLLRANGAPTAIPFGMPTDDLLHIVSQDNKRGTLDEPEGTVVMVLLNRLGEPNKTNGTVLTPVPLSVVREALDWSRNRADPYALNLVAPALVQTHAE